VSVTADGPPHIGADVHIVQNIIQSRMIPKAVFVPHWPQPGLIPRSMLRGSTFERVAFFGDLSNLAFEMRNDKWSNTLGQLGFAWDFRGPNSRMVADYTDVDVVVAIRSFHHRGYIRKPASKLQNAWIAGVPAICGREFAFREIGSRSVDFVEVESMRSCLDALIALREDQALRDKIVQRGLYKAVTYGVNGIRKKWCTVLERIGQMKSKRRLSVLESIGRTSFRCALALQHRVLRGLDCEHNAL
jgi:hypothetical protein